MARKRRNGPTKGVGPKGGALRPRWTESAKMEAVMLFVKTGQVANTCRELDIPVQSFLDWRKTDWWKEAEKEVRQQSAIQTAAKLNTLTEKGIAQLEDRIDNGDPFYNIKTKTIDRIPVKAKDLNQITKDTIDKKVFLDRLAQDKQQQQNDVNERLTNLMSEFLKFAKARTITEQDP